MRHVSVVSSATRASSGHADGSATVPHVSPEFETPSSGLTAAQVAERVARGETNDTGERTSRTYGEIVRANVFTRFNAILGTMLVVILAVGSPADGLFGIVLVANALIGIVQEIRAKRTLDQLAVLSAPKARIIRDGKLEDHDVEDLVLDDLLELRTGDQVPADGEVKTAEGLEIDESLLTGESDAVDKSAGSDVMSGSIVVAGSGRFQATAVGENSYARKLATEARRFALTRSELVDGINYLLRLIQFALFPIAGVLLWRQLSKNPVNEALTGTVAGVVGMVPEGLVLLTSLAFGIAAVTLARRNVLVQELPAVEGLARVDVVCLDKTGTLTEGDVVFDSLEVLDGADEALVDQALGALAADENRNATLKAIGEAFPTPGDQTSGNWARTGAIPFSSARKWSAAAFGPHGAWVIGAPEMILADSPDDPVRRRADEIASEGKRVLLLAGAAGDLAGETLPSGIRPASLVMLAEKIRPDAADTLRYFAEQGVELKVISGDNPRTVAAVARRVGLEGADQAFDARNLPEDRGELAEVLEHHSVFGRVTPQQKRGMVAALQSKGHVVAMTGDGVNDALALKDADIGIAMGSGAAATRAVAQLVLIDGKFSTMPGVVAEGRRVIAQHRARREPVRDQDGLRDPHRVVGRGRGLEVPVPAPPPDDHQHVHHRHPRVLPRDRAEQAALRPRLHVAGPALHDPRGDHRRGCLVDDVCDRPLRREPDREGVTYGHDDHAGDRRSLGAGDPGPAHDVVAGRARGGDGRLRRGDPHRAGVPGLLRPEAPRRRRHRRGGRRRRRGGRHARGRLARRAGLRPPPGCAGALRPGPAAGAGRPAVRRRCRRGRR